MRTWRHTDTEQAKDDAGYTITIKSYFSHPKDNSHEFNGSLVSLQQVAMVFNAASEARDFFASDTDNILERWLPKSQNDSSASDKEFMSLVGSKEMVRLYKFLENDNVSAVTGPVPDIVDRVLICNSPRKNGDKSIKSQHSACIIMLHHNIIYKNYVCAVNDQNDMKRQALMFGAMVLKNLANIHRQSPTKIETP